MTPPHASTLAATSQESPTLWRRLRKTPMRDIIRGRLTGRLDVEGAIARSGLPAEVQEVIRRTVRKSRLWRLERADLARELIQHFQDAAEAGSDPRRAAEQFGDSALAAKLIRRATRRKRPLPWQLARLAIVGLAATIGLIVVAYLVQAARVYGTSPNVAVDYRVQLNKPARALAEDQRAWPRYREALLGLPQEMPLDHFNRWPRPGEEGWGRVEAYLADNESVLDAARSARDVAGLGLVVGYEFDQADLELWPEQASYDSAHYDETGLIGVLLPHLADLRRLARVLAIDAIGNASAGNGAAAIDDIETLLAMGDHARELPILINDLVGHWVIVIALETIGELLAEYPKALTDDDLRTLAHRLAAFDDASLRVDLRGERMMFKDILQRTYSDDGDGNGFLTSEGFKLLRSLAGSNGLKGWPDAGLGASAPVLSAMIVDRRTALSEYNRYMDQLEVIAAQPAWERDTTPAHGIMGNWQATPVQRMRHLPLVTLAPAIPLVAWHTDKTMMRSDAVLVALAAELYRRRHGTWPQSINELTPALLPRVPIDRMTGDSMRYVIRDGRPLVYSVGSDLEDDGGMPGKPMPGYSLQAIEHMPPHADAAGQFGDDISDWILWPPLLEELEGLDD